MPAWPQLEKTLLKVLIPLAGIAIVFLVARMRRLSLRDDIGLKTPPLGESAVWVLVYAAWMLGTNYVMYWRGPWDFSVWQKSPLLIDVLRVLAVGILGPIAEELIFRGLLYGRLVRTRLGVRWTIILLAAAFAVLHTAYTPAVIAIIFVDGLLLGAARYRTKSVYVPIAMHLLWNLYAIW
jgi:membrane protease YdiL (CAAX protease family)